MKIILTPLEHATLQIKADMLPMLVTQKCGCICLAIRLNEHQGRAKIISLIPCERDADEYGRMFEASLESLAPYKGPVTLTND